MRKIVLTVAALSVLTISRTSMASDAGFYIKANVGVGMAMDADIDNIPGAPGTEIITYDSGLTASLAAGYDFANAMRMEVEVIRQKNDFTLSSYANFYGNFNEGDLKTHSFMVNGFYDIDTGSPWTPFVGIGIGLSKLDINGPDFHYSDSDNVFAYQFIGGVAYAINDQWSLDAQYRFMGTGDATIDEAEFDFNSNNLMLGLRYSF
jgi:opacity protein-like surface antigen